MAQPSKTLVTGNGAGNNQNSFEQSQNYGCEGSKLRSDPMYKNNNSNYNQLFGCHYVRSNPNPVTSVSQFMIGSAVK